MSQNSKKQKKSASENNLPLQMNGRELQFPVTYHLKAVMTTLLNDTENRRQLAEVFDELKIGYLFQSKNHSKKGNYVSFTFEITLGDRETMNRLYARLNEIKNLKFAL